MSRFFPVFVGWSVGFVILSSKPHVYHMPSEILDGKEIRDHSKVKIVAWSFPSSHIIDYCKVPLNNADKMKSGKVSESDVLDTINNPGNITKTTQYAWLAGSIIGESAIVAATYNLLTDPSWIARSQPNVGRWRLIYAAGAYLSTGVWQGFVEGVAGGTKSPPVFYTTRLFFRMATEEENGKKPGFWKGLLEDHYRVRVTHPDVMVKSDSFF
jgi:hypothetical protein